MACEYGLGRCLWYMQESLKCSCMETTHSYIISAVARTSDINFGKNLHLLYTAMQIGFEQDSYTVLETDESITVCVNMTTGNSTVPVTLAVLDIASAQGKCKITNCKFVFELV